VGATSGIGLALAEKLIAHGVHVIAVGRRQANLDSIVQKHGKDKVSAVKFDITDLAGIPDFAAKVTKAHPKLDSVILNSGIQRGLDFSKPDSVDLSAVSLELTTNYLSHIHLTTAFLPHLQSLSSSSPTSLVVMTSGLALVPLTRCGNYSASKAALHHLTLTMREQLSSPFPNLKVVEVYPPAVQTELHDEKHQPDIKNGGSIGMPLAQFTEEMWQGLEAGKEDVPVGTSVAQFEAVETPRRKAFAQLNEFMKKIFA